MYKSIAIILRIPIIILICFLNAVYKLTITVVDFKEKNTIIN